MRIAQVAPLYERVPPRLYGGTERIVSYLTEELVRKGHDVTLFASGDSITRAELVAPCESALRLNSSVIDPIPYHIVMLDQILERADEFDIIHFHLDLLHFTSPSSAASRRRSAPDRAIEAARATGMPLKIGAKVDPVDQEYFETKIEPLLEADHVEYVGEVGGRTRRPSSGRGRPRLPDRLGRAVRPGDDRGHGLRHAGDRLPQRIGARG
jgi:glycosyltransferase involved in cell wall biosynthesis